MYSLRITSDFRTVNSNFIMSKPSLHLLHRVDVLLCVDAQLTNGELVPPCLEDAFFVSRLLGGRVCGRQQKTAKTQLLGRRSRVRSWRVYEKQNKAPPYLSVHHLYSVTCVVLSLDGTMLAKKTKVAN